MPFNLYFNHAAVRFFSESNCTRLFLAAVIASFCYQAPVLAQSVKKDSSHYDLRNDEGVYEEKYDSTNVDDNRFTADNILYQAGNVYEFDYVYKNAKGERCALKLLSEKDAYNAPLWKTIPFDSTLQDQVTTVRMTVLKGLQNFNRYVADYSQTIIKYEYLGDSMSSSYSENTGLVENRKNIWIHPPRAFLFKILEINPFPFIMHTDNPWFWSLTVGDRWGDDRWKSWQGPITNEMTYNKIPKKVELNTPMGKLKCTAIESTAKSSLGITKLTAYYNETLGFVLYKYKNIDGSSLDLVLRSFAKGK